MEKRSEEKRGGGNTRCKSIRRLGQICAKTIIFPHRNRILARKTTPTQTLNTWAHFKHQ